MDFYPHYRTPHLTIRRDETQSTVLIQDGRSLLKDPLPPDATLDELRNAATTEILTLVVRDLVDLIPLLREHDVEAPYIEIDEQEMKVIRRMAFLRGRILFLPKQTARKLGKRMWTQAMKSPFFKPEEFEGNMPSMVVFSCDFVCSQLYPPIYPDIYANGRTGGGRGFNKESVFDLASDRGILISSMPQHPLERYTRLTPLEECKQIGVPEVKNDLELPEDFEPVKGSDFPIAREALRGQKEATGAFISDRTFDNLIMRINRDAREKIYRVGKTAMNRFEMMAYIPWAISEGRTRRDLCQGINGCPSMLEIAKWETLYPDFKESLRLAEQVQAHTFMDQAHDIVMNVRADKDEIAQAKLQSNFLMKRAALQDEKFRDKQVIQTENLNQKNELELKRTLKMLIMGHAEALDGVIDVTPNAPVPEGEEDDAQA